MEKIMNKLVRDKIPQIIAENKEHAIYHVLDTQEFIEALKIKMAEEYQEILRAQTKEEILEECADLLELLFALTKEIGFEEQDLIAKRVLKRENRGGFEQRIFLEKTI